MTGAPRSRRLASLAPGRSVTLRIVFVFGVLSALLIGVAVDLAFRGLRVDVRFERLARGSLEARSIAEAVAALGREPDGIDFSRLRQKQATLTQIIQERMAERPYVRRVEVLDRFGGRVITVAQPGEREGPLAFGPAAEDRPAGDDHVMRAQLRRGSTPQGEVRVDIDVSALQDLQRKRQSLTRWLALVTTLAAALLAAGLAFMAYLIRKNRRLEQSRLAAERRSYVGLLASGLAHEIRNPLNAMNMNLQMLEEELTGVTVSEDSEHAELLESTKSEIKRLESLVNNFLTYARPAEPSFETHDMNRTVREVAKFLQADFQQSGVELKLDLEPQLPSVEIDDRQFKQSLMNLLVNARQVLKNRGSVTLRTRAGIGGDVVVEIEDDGPGIPEEYRDRIFNVFESRRGGGTGLGLPIARQIVERHGGTIAVDTTVGRGTTFTIRLPRRHGRGGRTP